MSREIDYYYSHISPWSYLGAERFYRIADSAGAAINFKPVNLGTIFPQSGGLPLDKRAPQRKAYRMMELKRWKKHLGVEINFEPKHFPTDDVPAALLAVAAGRAGKPVGPLSLAVMRKCWVEDKDVADERVLAEAAGNCGYDGDALLTASHDPVIRQAYEDNTQEAMERQVFGAPTYIYRDELFWGQDRLDFLERALAEN